MEEAIVASSDIKTPTEPRMPIEATLLLPFAPPIRHTWDEYLRATQRLAEISPPRQLEDWLRLGQAARAWLEFLDRLQVGPAH